MNGMLQKPAEREVQRVQTNREELIEREDYRFLPLDKHIVPIYNSLYRNDTIVPI